MENDENRFDENPWNVCINLTAMDGKLRIPTVSAFIDLWTAPS